MGKASSSKKVARAQRAGGKGAKGAKQRNLGFPLAITAVVVLGVAVVAFAVINREDASAESPQINDHYHSAYAIWDCGTDSFQSPLSDAQQRGEIHTHADGLIHVHPFTSRLTGPGATMGAFFETIGVEVSDTEIDTGSTVLGEGGLECGGEEAVVQVAVWDDANTAREEPPDRVVTDDIGDIWFDQPNQAFTLALAPIDADVPPPNSLDNLARLNPETETLRPPTEDELAPELQDEPVPADPDAVDDGPVVDDPAPADPEGGEGIDSTTRDEPDTGEAPPPTAPSTDDQADEETDGDTDTDEAPPTSAP